MNYELTEAGERAVWPYLSGTDRIRALFGPNGGGQHFMAGRFVRVDVWHPKPMEAP